MRKLRMMAASTATLALLCTMAGAAPALADDGLGTQAESLMSALEVQAADKVATGGFSEVDGDQLLIINDAEVAEAAGSAGVQASYPSTFDLRHCDLDGTGDYANYVTSVKMQTPYGSCWAFAAIAASETSILSELRQDAVSTDAEGVKHDTLDLSEHHLAWFVYTPLTEEESATQAGEGAYSMSEEKAVKQYGTDWAVSERMGTGGMWLSAVSTFATGAGPVAEPDASDDSLTERLIELLYRSKSGAIAYTTTDDAYYDYRADWSIDQSSRYLQSYTLQEAILLPDAAEFDEDGNYSMANAQQVTALMKEQLMAGRALEVAFCADGYNPRISTNAPRYINTETYAHYTYDRRFANHCVTVVGWDDNYSKENFLTEAQKYDEDGKAVFDDDGNPVTVTVEQPPADGAWIVKNSWGSTDSWGQGLNTKDWGIEGSGYFYISYYDKSLTFEQAFDYDTTPTAETTTSIIDQYDYMPCETTRAIVEDDLVTTANVFTAGERQVVTQLSCVTSAQDETVTYQVYRLDSADQRIDQGQLVAQVTEEYAYAGYHRVQLDTPCCMAKGQVYAVAVTQRNADGYLLGVSADYNRAGYEAGLTGDDYYTVGVVNPGESYVYTAADDTWTDFSEMKAQLEGSDGDTKYLSYDNFPIKAYAQPASTSGWLKYYGSWYWFDSEGVMATGWKKVDGTWYHFTNKGVMATGWKKYDGIWYYFASSGAMATGWQKFSGVWYHFASSGAMATGWQKIGGKWYHFTNAGAMATGWKKYDGTWYWFASSGAMATNWSKCGTKATWYYLGSNGAMRTGWQKVGGSWYYLGTDGKMATGWKKLSGTWYHFGTNGVMSTGITKISGSFYYFRDNGAMYSGWIRVGTQFYYYFGKDGKWTGKSIML